MSDLFKEIIPSIFQGKFPILEDEKDYNAFIVNKALAMHMDTILYANEMNMYPYADKKLQYDYLFHVVRKRKRPFIPWDKKDKDDPLKVIMEYFNCSPQKAKDTINILTKEQIKEITEMMKATQ